MDASRRDYFRQAQTLRQQLGVLLVAGLLISWLMSHATARWLELFCVALLLICGAGLFVVSARLFTRHHPTISVFTDRLWYRGLREQVVMLRNVDDAQLVDTRMAGLPWRFIELTLGSPTGAADDDDGMELVRIPLDAIDGDADEMLELIRQRAALQRELAVVRSL
jgi:hypothetical protein